MSAAACASTAVIVRAQTTARAQNRPSRAAESYTLRERAARREFQAAAALQCGNGDEARYPNRIGSYSKGLPHDQLGEAAPAAYGAYSRALLALPDTGAFARVPLGGNEKLVNPMAGVAFDLEGIDIQKLTAPPAPALASADRAARAARVTALHHPV